MAFEFRVRDASRPPASNLLDAVVEEYTALAGEPFEGGIVVSAADFSPPFGAYIVGFDSDDPICGGGVRAIAAQLAEIKRMYVIPESRGRGAAKGLLAALEQQASEMGASVVRLDCKADTWPLYSGAGYQEIRDYNGNPHAEVWAEKVVRHVP